MIIELDMSSSTPIYVQLRNQIVKGIGKGELKTVIVFTPACKRCRCKHNDGQ